MKSNLPYHDKVSVWSSHSLIAKQIRSLPAQSRVLDVGTASGTLARMCQNRSLRFFGIEPNKEWAAIASPLYEQLWIESIVDMQGDSLTGYDAVVLADVLEHLPEPQAVLQKLVDSQLTGSRFFISVPNVANLWLRLKLLMGRFDYTERGILDRTHLRFFTRKTICNMVKETGVEIISLQVTPIPLELVSPFFAVLPGKWLHALLANLTSFLPSLLGYQFIIGARKR